MEMSTSHGMRHARSRTKDGRGHAWRIAGMIFAALGLIGLVLAFGSLNAQAGSAAAHRDAGLASLAVMFACGGWLTRIMWRDTGARLGLGARRPSRRR